MTDLYSALFTAGQDVLGYHTYLAQGGIGNSSEEYFDITYLYDRWYPSFFLKGHALPVLYSEFFSDDEDYYERQSSISAGAIFPLLMSNIESQYALIAGYHYLRLKKLSEIDNRAIDGIDVYQGRRDNTFIGFYIPGGTEVPLFDKP